MSKGSAPRPIHIPPDQFRDNWDEIFGKKKPEPLDEQTLANKTK